MDLWDQVAIHSWRSLKAGTVRCLTLSVYPHPDDPIPARAIGHVPYNRRAVADDSTNDGVAVAVDWLAH